MTAQHTMITAVDFAVPTDYTIGPRFPTWAEAVERARQKIQRFEYKGQKIRPDSVDFHSRRHFQEGDTLVTHSRAFVQMRITEPIQERAGSEVRSGQDGVAASWEVFHDGTVEALENSGAAEAVVETALAAQSGRDDSDGFKVLVIRTDTDGTKFWAELPHAYGYIRSTGSPMLDHIRANLNTMGVASLEILVDTTWQNDEDGRAWNSLDEAEPSPVKRVQQRGEMG